MTDSRPPLPGVAESSGPALQTAGALLRQARQARGLHIAALANSIKVSPQKLEMLESDRFSELPGATFTRALAQTVCRSLKIDPGPVMALLPALADEGLVGMSKGLNAPFRDRPGRRVPRDLSALKNPGVIGALLLMLAAMAVYVMPRTWVPASMAGDTGVAEPATVTEPVAVEPVPSASAVEPALPAASAAASAVGAIPSGMIETVYSAPAEVAGASQPATVVAVSGVLQLRASGESWVEVTDRRGRPLLSRLLQAGETVGVDGPMPLHLRIGNAAVTSVTYRGQVLDLAPATRDNVVRLDLK